MERATDYYEMVLEEHAEDAEYFLINAGESYMWAREGDAARIAHKLATIKRTTVRIHLMRTIAIVAIGATGFAGSQPYQARDIRPAQMSHPLSRCLSQKIQHQDGQ